MRIHHRLEKWIAVLDVRDFGVTLIKNLFDAGRLTSIADLYTLTEDELTPFFLEADSLARDKKSLGAQKVLSSLKSKTELSLASFVAGFDIEGMGETLTERLVDAGFDTLDKLFAATEEDIAGVNGFAETNARILVEGLAECAPQMRALLESRAVRIRRVEAGGALAGLAFCFTGELSVKRSDAEARVKAAGGSVRSSVAKGLSYLVTNDPASPSVKSQRARELGIPVINEAAFLELLKN
jgi:DNA ligase (NAD+)